MFDNAIAMPNTLPPITTGPEAVKYKQEIESHRTSKLTVWPFIKLLSSTSPQIIDEAAHCGVLGAKLYPQGMTTNSEDGIPIEMLNNVTEGAMRSILGTMQEVGMVLSIHGEWPGFCLDREGAFIRVLVNIAKAYPKLKIVLEHITEAATTFIVEKYPNVAATITLHHLCSTLDDVIGDKICPHNFCKPIPKRYSDMARLREVVMSQHPRFFFGSDSAPHLKENKESSCGCAGCFTAPLLLPGLAHTLTDFDNGWIQPTSKLEKVLTTFTSTNAMAWYGIKPSGATVSLVEEEWTVPTEIDPMFTVLVPWWSGKKLKWRIK